MPRYERPMDPTVFATELGLNATQITDDGIVARMDGGEMVELTWTGRTFVTLAEFRAALAAAIAAGVDRPPYRAGAELSGHEELQ